jgi:SWI/SNF-related matrix-associated actin-dependent regulator 1 of chromatin subfamily A
LGADFASLASRQLNNYGFRKASSSSSGRHEFGAAGFRRGCPELLRTLRRLDTSRAPKKGAASAAAQAAAAQALAVAQAAGSRGPGSGGSRGSGAAAAASDAPGGGGEGEPLALQAGVLLDDVAALKRDRAALLREVRTLREGAAATQASVRALSARLASTEAAQAQMLRWGAAAAHNHGASHHNINNSRPMLQGGAQPLSLPASDAKRGGRGAARQVSREGGALALAALSEAAAAAESRGARSIVAERLVEAEAAASAAASAAAEAHAAAAAAEEAAQRKRARADELTRGALAARSELQEAQAAAHTAGAVGIDAGCR